MSDIKNGRIMPGQRTCARAQAADFLCAAQIASHGSCSQQGDALAWPYTERYHSTNDLREEEETKRNKKKDILRLTFDLRQTKENNQQVLEEETNLNNSRHGCSVVAKMRCSHTSTVKSKKFERVHETGRADRLTGQTGLTNRTVSMSLADNTRLFVHLLSLLSFSLCAHVCTGKILFQRT